MFWGKPLWEYLKDPQDQPCPQMAQAPGLSQLQVIIDKLKQIVIQLREPSRSCETLSPSPHGA